MNPGDALSPLTHTVQFSQLIRYAGASGDFQPIHYDDAVARRHGLPGVIAHGMLTMGLMARILEPWQRDGLVLRDFSVRFRSIVRPGDELTITGTVSRVESAYIEVELLAHAAGQKKPVATGHARLSREAPASPDRRGAATRR